MKKCAIAEEIKHNNADTATDDENVELTYKIEELCARNSELSIRNVQLAYKLTQKVDENTSRNSDLTIQNVRLSSKNTRLESDVSVLANIVHNYNTSVIKYTERIQSQNAELASENPMLASDLGALLNVVKVSLHDVMEHTNQVQHRLKNDKASHEDENETGAIQSQAPACQFPHLLLAQSNTGLQLLIRPHPPNLGRAVTPPTPWWGNDSNLPNLAIFIGLRNLLSSNLLSTL